jgi:hypothetical protein
VVDGADSEGGRAPEATGVGVRAKCQSLYHSCVCMLSFGRCWVSHVMFTGGYTEYKLDRGEVSSKDSADEFTAHHHGDCKHTHARPFGYDETIWRSLADRGLDPSPVDACRRAVFSRAVKVNLVPPGGGRAGGKMKMDARRACDGGKVFAHVVSETCSRRGSGLVSKRWLVGW